MASPAAVLSILVKAQGVQAASQQLTALDKSGRKAASGLKATEANAKRSSKTFSMIGKTAGLAGVTLGAAGLAGGIKTAVSEFREAQKVGAQTNAVLKSTKGAANVTAREIGNLATAISKKTGIDDEQIQSSENMLLTFTKLRNETGKGNDIFNQATQAVTDMSVALGQSGKSSAIQLGKALNDPIKGITALRRVGVAFTADQQKQITTLENTGHHLEAQKLILRELRTEFAGSAAAQATAGDKFKVSLNNLAEAAGAVLVPQIDKAAVFFTRLMDQMVKGVGVGGAIVSTFRTTGTVIGNVAGAIASLVRGFQEGNAGAVILVTTIASLTAAFVAYKTIMFAVTAATKAQIAVQTALNVVTEANPYVLAATALAALAAALVVAYQKSETFRRIVDAAATAIRTGLAGAIRFILGGLSSFLGAVSTVARALGKDGLANKAAAGQRAIDDLRDSLNKVPARKNVEVAVSIKLDGQNVDVSKAKPLSPTPPGGDGPGIIGSKIASKVRNNAGVRKAASAAATFIPGFGATPGKPSSSLRGANSALGPFARIGARFGLGVSSGSRPGSITSSGNISYHSSGEAIDMANGRGPDAAKLAFFKYMKNRYGSRLAELIYTPGGPGIKNGHSFTYTGQVARDHYDHVHVAMDLGKPGVGIGDAFGRAGAFMGDGIGDVARLARGAGFKGQALINAIAIAGAESGFRSHASNRNSDGSIDRGYWQINSVHGSQSTFSPTGNARAAFAISSGGRNWHPWVTYNTGAYRRYLNQARAAAGSISGSATRSTSGGASSSAGSGAATAQKVNPLDQRLASADLAIQMAQSQPKTAVFAGGRRISSSLAQISALTAKRQLIGKRIRSIRKALKGHLSPAKRLALTQELTQRLGEHSQLGTDIAALRTGSAAADTGGDIGGGGIGADVGTGDGTDGGETDAQKQAREATEALTQAMVDHMNALQSLQDEISKQNQFATDVRTVQMGQLAKGLADFISGQIAGYGGTAGRSLTAGAGTVARY